MNHNEKPYGATECKIDERKTKSAVGVSNFLLLLTLGLYLKDEYKVFKKYIYIHKTQTYCVPSIVKTEQIDRYFIFVCPVNHEGSTNYIANGVMLAQVKFSFTKKCNREISVLHCKCTID